MERKKYELEWSLLQNQFESYEKHSLYIKLISILVLLLSEVASTNTAVVFFILLLLWLQDSIWKTFQSRIEPRLLQIEKNIREGTEGCEFQFNSEYQKIENSGIGKICEYAKQAMRPTVAFPHVALVILFIGRCIGG
ncbi:hypothetical protein [Zooshikella sp. RANM57]|uniref:hypothetical protein n=1 Tax=Zooshikella sp. RANM57 TaxID=3425863 RepID=UPI003D6F5ABD